MHICLSKKPKETEFTDWISEINNRQIDNAKETDVVMSMYNLIEYSDNYSETSASLWQYYRDEHGRDVTNTYFLVIVIRLYLNKSQ